MLSIGVFFIIIVEALLLLLAAVISWALIIPVVLVLSGFWTVAIAALRSSKPQKYERGAFSTAALGAIMIALGGTWYLLGVSLLYSVIPILLVLGALAIAAALRRK